MTKNSSDSPNNEDSDHKPTKPSPPPVEKEEIEPPEDQEAIEPHELAAQMTDEQMGAFLDALLALRKK